MAATSPFPAPWGVDWSGSGKAGSPDISPMHIVRSSEIEASVLPQSEIYEDGDGGDICEGWEGAGGWGSQGDGYMEEVMMMRGTADPTNSLSQLDSPVATMKLRPEIEEGMIPLHKTAVGRHNHRGRPSSSSNTRMQSSAAVSGPPARQADLHDSSPVADHSGEVPSGDVWDEQVADTAGGGGSGSAVADGMGTGAVKSGAEVGRGIFPEQDVCADERMAFSDDGGDGGVQRVEGFTVSGGFDETCTVDQTGGGADGQDDDDEAGDQEEGDDNGGTGTGV